MDGSTTNNPHIGSSFADYLESQGLRGEVDAQALRDVLAWLARKEEPQPPPHPR